MKFNYKFILITLIVSLIIVPSLFNFLFLWESGLSNGKTSDWFTLYGNIIGGLIGGFFTYLSLLLTFKEQKETKIEEMRPRIDILYQTIEFIDSDAQFTYNPIVFELNNLGGSIAKNIKCSLSLTNFGEVLKDLEDRKTELDIEINRATNQKLEEHSISDESTVKISRLANLCLLKNGEKQATLGNVYKEYRPQFIGNCVPLVLDYEAKAEYTLPANISLWTSYIVQNTEVHVDEVNENKLFKFLLKIKYSSDKFGDFEESFKLNWEFVEAWSEEKTIKYKYILKSEKSES